METLAAAPAHSASLLTSLRLFRRVGVERQEFGSYQMRTQVLTLPVAAPSPPPVPRPRVPTKWFQQAFGVAVIGGFVLLTWLRAESLMHMMPRLFDLGLGVLAGVIGNTLGYWFGLLGVAPTPACAVSQTLKMAQIVGVPVAYVLLGGHMLLMPVMGALVAAALVLVTHRLGWACRLQANR